VCNLAQAEPELNQFLRTHRVVAVEKQWIERGENSYWLFAVEYLDAPAKPANESRPAGDGAAVDWRKALTDEQFEVFSRLRTLRKEISLAESTPVYMVFTNEQLAAMVRQRVTSKEALKQVDRVGQARIDKVQLAESSSRERNQPRAAGR
jgi:superfamily II DNA helicase RecQ